MPQLASVTDTVTQTCHSYHLSVTCSLKHAAAGICQWHNHTITLQAVYDTVIQSCCNWHLSMIQTQSHDAAGTSKLPISPSHDLVTAVEKRPDLTVVWINLNQLLQSNETFLQLCSITYTYMHTFFLTDWKVENQACYFAWWAPTPPPSLPPIPLPAKAALGTLSQLALFACPLSGNDVPSHQYAWLPTKQHFRR